jgi:hypothetical protein
VHQIVKLTGTAILVLSFLAGCGGHSNDDGYVRLVNATSEYATLDLYESTSELTKATASYSAGAYASLTASTYTFNINGGGSSLTAASVSGAISKSGHYTIVAYTTGGVLTASYLTESEAAPASGTAKLRVFNTDVGNVDGYLAADCSSLAASATAAFASDVAGLQTSYTSVTASGSGTSYHVCITAPGDKADVRLDVPVTFTSTQITTLILTHSTGGTLLNGLLLQQQSSLTQALNTSARLRVAVGATGGSKVTVMANGTTLASNLGAPAVTSYRLVDAGPLTLQITNGGAQVSASGLTAAAGADLTLLIAGGSGTTPILLSDDNAISASSTNPVKIRLVNGMNSTGTVTLTDDYNNIGDGAAFGTATTYAQVPSSSALARLEALDGGTQLCLSTDVTLNASSVYTVFLLGDVPSATPTCTIRVDR